MHAGVLLSIASLFLGWAALFPLRTRLGASGYHLASLPVGLLGWAIVYSAAVALKTGYEWWLVGTALAIWTAAIWALGHLVNRDSDALSGPESEYAASVGVPWWSFAIVFALVLAFAWAIAAVGVTAYSVDGWSQYVPDGMIIHDIGKTSGRALGHRMTLLTSIHAGYYLFGGEFPQVIHPVMGLVTAALLFASLWWSGFRRRRAVWRGLLSAGVTALMVSNAVFLFMSLYIHSHMITAMYMLLAIVAVERAMRWSDRGARGAGAMEPAWMIVAGLATAAILLARPDGAAYSMIPFGIAVAALVRERIPQASVDAFFAPLVTLGVLSVAGPIVQAGIWESDKLSGTTMLAFILMQMGVWAVVRQLAGRELGWVARGANALRLALAASIPVLAVAWRRAGDEAILAFQNMSTNLLSQGGYRFVWPYAASVFGISLLLRPKRSRNPYTAYAFFAVAQFFAIALAVHTLTHPGRLGWGDSFNRVAFHILPVFYLYAGYYLGELFEAWVGADESG